MASISQFDIENRFGDGGSEGTDYEVTITTDGDVITCTVTDAGNSDATVVTGEGRSEGEASQAARRALNIADTVVYCLTTTQKDTLSPKDGTQAVDITLNQLDTRQGGAWVAAADTVETKASTATSYTLIDSDSGKHLTFNNASDITVTLDTGLKAGFRCTMEQIGVGQVQVSANGTTINSLNGDTKTAGQFAVVSLVQTATDVFTFSGATTS